MTTSLNGHHARANHPVLFPSRKHALMRAGAVPQEQIELDTTYGLPISGQGVFAITTQASGPFRIYLTLNKFSFEAVILDIGRHAVKLIRRHANRHEEVLAERANPVNPEEARVAVETDAVRTYWLSLDTQNFTLVYGKGYVTNQFKMLEYRFTDVPTNPQDFWTSEISKVKLSGGVGAVSSHQTLRYPATYPTPPVIAPFATVTMDQVAKDEGIAITQMPPESQVLYGTVGGPAFQLDTPDFPDFAEAINYSIVTPGCICYEKLAEKFADSPFSKDPHENYLRVTLGHSYGDSPGIPYVLELWPMGNFSPIHNHSDAYAVIKVLHGTIWVQVFAEFSTSWPDAANVEYEFPADGVTWLSPQCFQTHRLKNRGDKTMTATIQPGFPR